MVEYGGGIDQGPAGQVTGGGGGGTPIIGGGGDTDLGAPIARFLDDAIGTLSSLSPLEMVILAFAVFLGLLLLRRAF